MTISPDLPHTAHCEGQFAAPTALGVDMKLFKNTYATWWFYFEICVEA